MRPTLGLTFSFILSLNSKDQSGSNQASERESVVQMEHLEREPNGRPQPETWVPWRHGRDKRQRVARLG